MNIVKTYRNHIKKYAGTHPAVSRKMIDIGLHLEQFRTEHFAEKTMPKAYQKLNTLGVKNTLHALEYPESTVWCNLFAPVNFPVLRTQCAFHGMSFLVSLRIYV